MFVTPEGSQDLHSGGGHPLHRNRRRHHNSELENTDHRRHTRVDSPFRHNVLRVALRYVDEEGDRGEMGSLVPKIKDTCVLGFCLIFGC